MGDGGGGRLSSAPPSTCLASRYRGFAAGDAQGGTPFTVLPVSLSPSPPFSVFQQAGQGLIKNIRTICAEHKAIQFLNTSLMLLIKNLSVVSKEQGF